MPTFCNITRSTFLRVSTVTLCATNIILRLSSATLRATHFTFFNNTRNKFDGASTFYNTRNAVTKMENVSYSDSLVNNKVVHRRRKLPIKLPNWMSPSGNSQMKQKCLGWSWWGWCFLASSGASFLPCCLIGWTYKTARNRKYFIVIFRNI